MIPVKRRKQKPALPAPLLDAGGRLTRYGAMAAAREKLGYMATISSYDDPGLPRVAWVVGDFYATVGRGKTWEDAVAAARPSQRIPKEEPRPKRDPVIDYHADFDRGDA